MNSILETKNPAPTAATTPAARERGIAHPWITLLMAVGMGMSLIGAQGLGRPAPGTLVPANDAHMGIFSIGVTIFMVTWVVAVFVAASAKHRGWILTTLFMGPVGALLFGALGPRKNERYVLSSVHKAVGGTAVAAAALLFIGGFSYFCNVAFEGPKVAYEHRFAPFLRQYATMSVDLSAIPSSHTFSGNFVVIDKRNNTLDTSVLYDSRLDGLRANSPAEVTTIIWVQYREDTVGTYQSGAKAYQWFVDLTFIQRSTAQATGQVELAGSAPPDSKSGYADWHGSQPSTGDIVKAILAAHTS